MTSSSTEPQAEASTPADDEEPTLYHKIVYRLRCSGCDWSQTCDETSAHHFNGTDERAGHSCVAEWRQVIATEWKPLGGAA